jgi:sugar lactone lactonase YvrE
MTPIDRLERRLPDGLTDLADPRVPSYLDDILADTARKRQRPAWSFLERWLPMTLVLRRPATAPPLRAAWVLILAAALALALAGGALVAGTRMLLSGPPNNGPLAAMPPTACPPGTVLKSGDIATIAGTGVAGNSGDDGPAIAAALQTDQGMAVDASGDIYFSDKTHGTIRRIGTDGTITSIAGPVSGQQFVSPSGMDFDAAGNLFVADYGAGRIWKIDPSGAITTVVGKGPGASGDGGPALDAQLNASQVAVGPRGDLYFDDWSNYRTVDTAGIVNRFAGTGAAGFAGDEGPAIDAQFSLGLGGIEADSHGNVYFGDGDHHRIRMVDPSGIIHTIAGTGLAGYSGDGGPATDADIGLPSWISVDDSGKIYFGDNGNHTVRVIDSNGIIHTLAGNGTSGDSGDCGPAVASHVGDPEVDVRDGVVYILDIARNRIRMIVP